MKSHQSLVGSIDPAAKRFAGAGSRTVAEQHNKTIPKNTPDPFFPWLSSPKSAHQSCLGFGLCSQLRLGAFILSVTPETPSPRREDYALTRRSEAKTVCFHSGYGLAYAKTSFCHVKYDCICCPKVVILLEVIYCKQFLEIEL